MVSDTLQTIGNHLQTSATVRTVYGDPITVGGRTVVPIARLGYGFGGNGKGAVPSGTVLDKIGGGGGMGIRPLGALEISESGTRFIPFVAPARIGIAALLGFLIGLVIGRRSAWGRPAHKS